MEDPPAQGRAGGGGAEWLGALRGGLLRRGWCEDRGSADVPVGPRGGVTVWRLRPRVPLVLLSGATPGKFYHSHPHVPSEFDELDFDMASQVRANLTTIRKIGANVGDHASELPFAWPPAWGTAAGAKAPGAPPLYLRTPLILHWVSNRGAGFEANRAELDRTAAGVLRELGMDSPTGLGTYETGGNVSDRRFLLETFAAFGLDGACVGEAGDAPPSGHARHGSRTPGPPTHPTDANTPQVLVYPSGSRNSAKIPVAHAGCSRNPRIVHTRQLLIKSIHRSV